MGSALQTSERASRNVDRVFTMIWLERSLEFES